MRRPLRLDLEAVSARAAPCVEGTGSISVCAGPWATYSSTALRGSGWSVAPTGSASEGYEGSLRLRKDSLGVLGSVDFGDGISAQSAGLQAGFAGAKLRMGVGRAHRWSNLEISSASGSLDLPWDDVTDSGFVGFDLPLGPLQCSSSLWRTTRRSASDTGMADTGRSLGWSVSAVAPTSLGSWRISLDRVDRVLSTTGRFQGRIFHDQEWTSRRAEARFAWTGGNWEVQAGTRQYRMDSPQGDLEHPTLTWNILSKQRYAAVYAVASDQRDYFSGSLSVERWDAGFRHSWNGRSWRAWAGLDGRLWNCRADFARRRLLVAGLIPSVSLDSLASGDGWLAALGPEAAISWRSARFGRVELSASCSAPLAGDWNDHIASPGPASPASSRSSLPLDPWSLWSLRLTWSQ